MKLHGPIGGLAVGILLAASFVGSRGAQADLAPPPGVTLAPPVPEAELASIRKVDDTHFELGRALFKRIVKSPESIGVRIQPSLKADKRQGYAVFGIRRWQTADKLGLQNGDIVTAVNGVDLAAAKLSELTAKLDGVTKVTLQLIRAAKPLTLEYDIKG